MARTKAQPAMFKRKAAPAPSDLPESGRALWKAIVTGYDADHFTAADLPLLSEYVRCKLMIDACNEEIGIHGMFQDSPSGLKPHPAVTVRDAQIKNLASLATKLRLPVSSRIRADSASTRPRGVGARPWEEVSEVSEFFD